MLKILSFLGLLLIPMVAEGADPVLLHSFTGQQMAVRLFDSPCVDKKVVGRIKPEHVSKFRMAKTAFLLSDGAIEVGACWNVADKTEYKLPEHFYFLMLENGKNLMLPSSMFNGLPPKGIAI